MNKYIGYIWLRLCLTFSEMSDSISYNYDEKKEDNGKWVRLLVKASHLMTYC
jgi:hypothetical protein